MQNFILSYCQYYKDEVICNSILNRSWLTQCFRILKYVFTEEFSTLFMHSLFHWFISKLHEGSYSCRGCVKLTNFVLLNYLPESSCVRIRRNTLKLKGMEKRLNQMTHYD